MVSFRNLCSNDNVRKGVLYTLFSFLNNGISFVLLLILANYLLPEDYGYLNLYNIFVQIISILIALGTNPYISNAYFQKSRSDLYQIIMIVFLISLGVLFFNSIILVIFPDTFSNLIGIPVTYLWIALFICYFQAFTNINLDIWRLEEKPVSYGIFSLSIAILNFILTFVFIVGLNEGWVGRVYSQALVSGLFFIISLLLMIKRGYIKFQLPKLSLLWETLLFGIPLVPHMVSFWLKQGMDRYIINYYYQASDVGLYSFALNFAAVIGIFATAFNANNSVYIYKNLAKGYGTVKSTLQRNTKVMTILFIVVSISISIGAYSFIPILLPEYAGCIKYIFPICLGAFFQCIYVLYVNYIFFYKKTRQLMYITFSTGVLQFSLSIWFTRYSILWTAYISMAITIITAILVYIYSRKLLILNATKLTNSSF